MSTLVLPTNPEGWALRIAHTLELINTFRGYANQMPQHTEYYESVIEHLEVLLKGYRAQLEKDQCKPTLN